jgi:hypothetical protein
VYIGDGWVSSWSGSRVGRVDEWGKRMESGMEAGLWSPIFRLHVELILGICDAMEV